MSTTTPIPTTPAPFADDDPRAILGRAVALGSAVVAAVRPDQLALPTPCGQYDVRALLGHLVGVLHRAAAVGRGEDPWSVPETIDGVADDGWVTAWREAAHEAQAAWTDDATLERSIDLTWAVLSGGEALIMWAGEVTTHTWDLASATGQSPQWDDTVVAAGLASIQALLPAEGRMEGFAQLWAQFPPELRARPYPFDAAVDVPADAPLIDQLVAWCGRRPASAQRAG